MNPRLLLRLTSASPITIAIAVTGMLTVGALAAAGMGVLGTAGPRTPAGRGALSIAGRTAQALASQSAPSPSPAPTPSRSAAPSVAPLAPATGPAAHAVTTASPPVPPAGVPPSVTAAMARKADPGQFQDVNFGCTSGGIVVVPGSEATLMCGVTSINGFSGQIRTECDPFTSPYLTLPGIGHPSNPGYITCSAPTVTVPAGGGTLIPITVQVSTAAPAGGWGAPVFLTLWYGATMLDPGPYDFGVSSPPVPVDFTLTCQAVTRTTNSATVTSTSGGPPVVISLGPELVGNCTVTAADPANIVPTWVEISGISSPGGTTESTWAPCFGSSEAQVFGGPSSGCGTREAGVTPAGGTGTVWFSLAVPPTAIGTGPTTITFAASHDQQTWPVSSTLTISF